MQMYQVLYWNIMYFPVCTALSRQEVSVLNSAYSKPSVTPVDGAVSLATAHARHAMAHGQQTATYV